MTDLYINKTRNGYTVSGEIWPDSTMGVHNDIKQLLRDIEQRLTGTTEVRIPWGEIDERWNWVAQDANGKWHGYVLEPRISQCGTEWTNRFSGDFPSWEFLADAKSELFSIPDGTPWDEAKFQRPTEPVPSFWEHVPSQYNYIAQDRGDRVWVYREEPYIDGYVWWPKHLNRPSCEPWDKLGTDAPAPFLGDDWSKSLQRRP